MQPGYAVGAACVCVLAVAALTTTTDNTRGTTRFGALVLIAAAIAAWGIHASRDSEPSTVSTRDTTRDQPAPLAARVRTPHKSHLSMHEALAAPLASAAVPPITEHDGQSAHDVRLRGVAAHSNNASSRMAFHTLRKPKIPTQTVHATAQDITERSTRLFQDFVAANSTQTPEDFAQFWADERRSERIAAIGKENTLYMERTPLTDEEREAYAAYLPVK